MSLWAYKICKSITSVCMILCFIFLIISTYMYLSKASRNEEGERKTQETILVKYPNAVYNHTKVDLLHSSIKAVLPTIPLTNEVTVVTAYLYLGSFAKGEEGYYTPDLYRKWMTVFKHIENPVVAYFDSAEFCDYFKALRQDLPANKTRVIHINRDDLWAFRLQKRVSEIFKQPGYPRHHPNTVKPEYSCSMHAKYELMNKSIVENAFGTKFFSWVDIGLFRHLSAKGGSSFGIFVPHNFMENSVAYGEVRPRREDLIPLDVVYGNLVWVCGCFFIGRTDVLLRWTLEYMEGVDWLLNMNLMGTDQQVIYAMANANLARTPIQAYKNTDQYNNYFHLGYQARKAWFNKFNPM